MQFTLVAPLFLLLFFAVINFATLIYTYSEVAYSAYQGARWASVRGSTYSCSTCTPSGPAVQSDVSNYILGMTPWLNNATNPPTVTVTWTPVACSTESSSTAPASSTSTPTTTSEPCCPDDENNCPGSTVQVKVQYSYQLTTPFLPSVRLPVTSTSQFVISQ